MPLVDVITRELKVLDKLITFERSGMARHCENKIENKNFNFLPF
jgi:hypothetical protein